MQEKILSLLILLVLMFSCAYFLNRNNNETFPKKTVINKQFRFHTAAGFVNDFENLIDRVDEISFTRLIQTHENKTTNQIAIVTLDTIYNNQKFDAYTLALANHWGVGQKDKDNGILIAVSKKYKKMRIQVGDGLLKKLTNKESQNIVDSIFVPQFKLENYAKGIENGLIRIIKELE